MRELTCIKDFVMEDESLAFAAGGIYYGSNVFGSNGTEIDIKQNAQGRGHLLYTKEEGFWECFSEEVIHEEKNNNEIFDLSFNIQFKISSACDYEAYREMGLTPIELVKRMIEDEGLIGITDDDFEVKDAWIED